VKRPSNHRRWLVRATGLGLAFLAGLWLSQSSARASCGDYLMRSAVAAKAGVQAMDEHADFPAPLKHKQPCSGPNCSGRSEPMPLAPVTVPPQTGEQWGWFSSFDPIQAPDVGLPVSLPLPVHAIHTCSPLERPPRLNDFAASL
jgi:hypothetical protein